MKFGVSETARIFEVDRNLVKTWAYHFSDYLGSGANPGKGLPRQFSADDLRVLAFISMYWEDQPDLEYIKIAGPAGFCGGVKSLKNQVFEKLGE